MNHGHGLETGISLVRLQNGCVAIFAEQVGKYMYLLVLPSQAVASYGSGVSQLSKKSKQR